MAATTAIPTDEEIRTQAESLYNPAYQSILDTLSASASSIETQYTRDVSDADKLLTQTLADTKLSVENSLLKRGMGRSTRAAYEVTAGLADVNASAEEYLAQLQEDKATALANIETQRLTETASYEQNVSAKVLDLMQYYESVRQFNEQMALAEKELALAYGGGGGGGGGGSSKNTFVDLTNQGTGTSKSSTSTSGSGYLSGVLGLSQTATAASALGVSKSFTGEKNGRYYVKGKLVSRDAYLNAKRLGM